MKLRKRIAAALLGVMTVISAFPAGVANATTVNTYTYNYDYWGLEYESPDAYKPISFTNGKDLGVGAFKAPKSMFARDNSLYVVDTGNNRILELTVDEKGLTWKRTIDHYNVATDGATEETTAPAEETAETAEETAAPAEEAAETAEETAAPAEEAAETAEETAAPAEEAAETAEETAVSAEEVAETAEETAEPAEETTDAEDETAATEGETTEAEGETAAKEEEKPANAFNSPQDVYVAENGDIYITDQGNGRILHLDKDCNLIKEILKPDSPLLDQKNPFEPSKIVVDRSGRMFVLAKNVNKGVMQFEKEGNFVGFIGASEVVFSMSDMIKKKFATKAQRDQMIDFVPTEYNNLFIDNKSFIYCTTEVFEEADLDAGNAKPIRKLNSLGGDILIRNGEMVPCGDWVWGDAAGMSGPSRIVDITAMDDETYYVVDRVRGRLFGYDEQGHLLYAFGGPGNQLGYFTYPIAIEHIGTDLYVLDTTTGGITKFSRTEFGNLIHSALDEYDVGNYEKSAEYWEEVLAMNGNYELAYIGIGRSYLRQQDYKTAMEYFKVMRDDENYSRAWKYYRKDWIENNLGYVIIVLVVLGFIPVVVKKIKKIRWEAKEQYEFESESKNK